MNVSKLLVLCLALLSFTCLLLSTHCAGSAFVTDFSTFPPDTRIVLEQLGVTFVSVMIFVITSPPAIMLAIASLGTWFFLVRRQSKRRKQGMAHVSAREVSLQHYLDRITHALVDPTKDETSREASARGIGLEQALAHELDGRQRERLSIFLCETGLTKESVIFTDGASPEVEEPARIQLSRRIALIVTVVLAIASFVFLLIGVVTGLMTMVFDPMEIYMGRKSTPGEVLGGVFFWLVPSIAAAVSGASFWLLFQHEQRSVGNFQLALEASKESLLQGSLQGMEGLLGQGSVDRTDPLVKTLLRARVLSALPALDGEKKRRLLEFLYTSGCLGDDMRLDLAGADFAASRLSGIQMENVCLSGIDLNAADLHRAEMNRVDLSRCNLSGCDLRRSELRGCDLRQANLSQARLGSANLMGCDLSVANITAEQLRGVASLQGAILPDGKPSTRH